MKKSTKGSVALYGGVVFSVSSAVYGMMTDPMLKLTNLETNMLFFYLVGVFFIGLGIGIILASETED